MLQHDPSNLTTTTNSTYHLVVELLHIKVVRAHDGKAVADVRVLADAERARRADDESLHELEQVVPRWVILVGLGSKRHVFLLLCRVFPVLINDTHTEGTPLVNQVIFQTGHHPKSKQQEIQGDRRHERGRHEQHVGRHEQTRRGAQQARKTQFHFLLFYFFVSRQVPQP